MAQENNAQLLGKRQPVLPELHGQDGNGETARVDGEAIWRKGD